jgi:hypothetical protein
MLVLTVPPGVVPLSWLCSTVTMAELEVAEAWALSAALVAVTLQLPAPVPVKVAPLKVQGPLTRL